MNAEISEEARRAELSEQHRVRMEKMEALRAQGIDPFGGRYEQTHHAREILDNYEELEGRTVSVACLLYTSRCV